MVHIELDTIAFYDSSFQKYLKEHKISTLVLSFHGPAGGAMAIRYSSTIFDIVMLVLEYWKDPQLLIHMEEGV